jgi:hypothetical protein
LLDLVRFTYYTTTSCPRAFLEAARSRPIFIEFSRSKTYSEAILGEEVVVSVNCITTTKMPIPKAVVEVLNKLGGSDKGK